MSKYVIDDSTLTGIADAIRTKEETSDPIPVEEMAERIGAIETGVTLPTLSNPASPSEILNGYEAIGEDGSVIEGEALATASTATAADIMSGKTAYNSAGVLLTGTAKKGYTLGTRTLNVSSTTKISLPSGWKKAWLYAKASEGSYSEDLFGVCTPSGLLNTGITYFSCSTTSNSITLSPFNSGRNAKFYIDYIL